MADCWRSASTIGRRPNIWIHDLSGTGSMRQLTSVGRNRFPTWSSDGRRVIFQSNRDGDASMYWQFADGSGTADRLTRPERGVAHVPDSASPDGNSVLFEAVKDGERTLWTLDVRNQTISPFGKVEPGGLSFDATFSPNGRWVAYRGRGTASSAVFVEPVPPTGEKRLIAPGINPVWSPDGHELVIRQLTTSEFVAMGVSTDPSFTIGPPRQLPRSFPTRASNAARRSHDMLADGKRFISLIPADPNQSDRPTAQFEVVLHWFEG